MNLISGLLVYHVRYLFQARSNTFRFLYSPAINCTDSPPEKPTSGTWEWNGDLNYATTVTYTCGPYGNFESGTGDKYKYLDSVCSWNKSWTPSALDPCVATSCQVIPFPPPETGMVFQPDPLNPITLASEFNVYNPKLPLTMGFPGDFCGDNGNILMIVGIVPLVTLVFLELISFECLIFRKVESL